MNKLLLLTATVSLSFSVALSSFAQENNSTCSANSCSERVIVIDGSNDLLTEAKWQEIARRYYQSRLRSDFQDNNNLLSIWDVQEFLGFSGTKIKTAQTGNRQYWIWRDRYNPKRKIEATFNYYKLVDLQGTEFDTVPNDFIRELTSNPKTELPEQLTTK